MKRKFRASNGKIYEIDDSQVNSFMKTFPDAVEVTEYSANGKVYEISNDQLPSFMKTFPDAFPEKKKESTQQTTGEETPPQGAGSQDTPTPSQKRVELSEKKSRVNSSIENLYQIQKDMQTLILESRNPSLDFYPKAAKKAEINRLYEESQKILKELKSQAGSKGEYYYPGIEQAINNMKTKADQADTQGWDPAYTKTQIDPDVTWLKSGLYEVEKSSGKPGILTKERKNVDIAKYTESVKKAQAEINKMGVMGRKDGWSKEDMEKYMAPAIKLVEQEANELAKKLPENQRYITSGMVESAKALAKTYIDSVGAWTDKQTEQYTKGHNEWAARTVSEIEDGYNITSDQRKQAGGVPEDELDAYIATKGLEFNNLDVNLIKEVNKPSDPSKPTILSPGQGQAKKKVMDAAVSDYFTYMDRVNPSMSKTWRQKYEYLKNEKGELNAEDEEFLLEFESKSMRMAMAALDRKIKDKQFEISVDSDFESSLDLDKYRRSMMQLEGESKKIQSEYLEASKKAKEMKTQFEAETGSLSKNLENLQNLLAAGMISEDDYITAAAPMMNELERKQKTLEANFPKFDDLETRKRNLDEKVAQIKDETGVNDAAIEKLQSLGDKYSTYAQDAEKMEALVGVNGQIGSFYNALKERERKNERAAEFRVKGMDSELGREIEEGPWYSEYLAKGIHYSVGQVWGSEVVRGYSGMVGNQIVGLGELPAIYASLAGSDDYGWTDKLMDMTVNFKKSGGREGSFGDVSQYGYDMWMPGKIANMGGSVAGSIVMFMTPGRYLNTGTKLTKWATNWGSSFLLSQTDMYEENLRIAKEYNKSAQWAAGVTQGEAAVLATVELMVGDLDYMKTPEVRKSIVRAFAEGKTMKEIFKGIIEAAPESTKVYLKKMIPEGIEEGSGTLGTDAYKEYIINGKVKYFNDTFNWKNISIDVLGGFMGGAIGGVMNRPIKSQDLEIATYLSALNADELYKNAKNEKNLKDLKEKLEGPKKDLQILSTHSNWDLIDDGSRIRAFSLNQSIKGLQEQIEADKKSNVVDEKKVQQLAEMTDEMNEILSAPEVSKGASFAHYSNTRDLINALQSGDSELSDIIENPIWGKLTEDSRTQIEDISYDLRKLNESMKKMDKRSPEYKSALEQVADGKKQIKEILNNTKAYDSENIPGVSSTLGEGQELVGAESQQRAGAGATEAGGVLQTPKATEQVIEELTKAIEDDNKAIEETGDPILTPEARTQMERRLFDAKSEQAKAATQVEQQPTEQPVAEGEVAPVTEATTEPSTEQAVTEEVTPEQKTDQQKEIERLEGLLAQDTQATQQTGKGILASRPAVENRLAALKEEEKMTEKEDKRSEEDSKREDAEYESNKKSLKKVDPTLTERQADLATALFQDGMDAKKAIAEAKKKISLEDRASKMKTVTEKVIGERKSRIAKEMGATANSLKNFFKNAGMKVEFVKSSKDFERDYAENGATKTTEGMFIAKDGTIVFNQEKLEDMWDTFGKNIMFHEAIHPVMNIVRNTDPKLYSSIVNGLKNEVSRNEGIKKAWDFANQEQYTSKGEEVVEDEFIVESLAMIADGKIKLSALPSQKRNFLIRAFSKLGEKFGIKGPSENADDEELRKFANKLHKALTKGGLLENIVGEENLTKYEKKLGNTVIQDVIGQSSIRKFGKSGITKKPKLDDKKFIKKLKDGQVNVKTPVESLGDESFMLTFPDDLFVGEIVIGGKVVAKFGGGVIYALVEGDKGRMWASVNDKTAKAFAENVNRALKQSKDGVARVVLVKGAHTKHATSMSAKVGFVKTLLKFAEGNKEYEEQLVSAIKGVYSIGNTKNIPDILAKFDAYLSGTREESGQTMKEAADSYDKFRSALVKQANPMLVDLAKKMGYGDDVFDKNGLKKSPPIYRAINNFVDKIFADMLQEDFLNNLPEGSAYAALKVTSPVKFEKDNSHPSYPWVIRTIDGSPVTVDIFSHSFMAYGENEAVTGRDVAPGEVSEAFGSASYTLPKFKLKPGLTEVSSGVTKLNDKLADYEALKDKAQLSIGGRTAAEKMDNAEKMLENLQVAKEMFKKFQSEPLHPGKSSMDAEKILMATGWQRGIDKMWRFEIPDGNLKISTFEDLPKTIDDDSYLRIGGNDYKIERDVKLSDVLDAPELFKAYGDESFELNYTMQPLADIRVIFADLGDMLKASYSPSNNLILISTQNKSIQPSLMHEIQHYIQEREGFERGSSPLLQEEGGMALIDMQIQNKLKSNAKKQIDLLKKLDLPGVSRVDKDRIEEEINQLKWERKKIVESIEYSKQKSLSESAIVRYEMAAGEVEARNVSRRLKYSPEQRKRMLFSETEDVSRAYQLVLGEYLFANQDFAQASQGGRKLPENISIVNGWYSPIEKKLRETNIDKQSAQKWLTSGIIGKGDEAIYTRVKGWLEGKKPTDQVSKQEILDWMDNNRVEIEEVSKGGQFKMSAYEARMFFENKGYDVVTDRNGDTYVEKDEELYDYNDMSPEEQDAWDVLTSNNLDSPQSNKTKYEAYQVEGEKSNYKELLVTLPSESSQDYKIVKGKDGKYRIKNPDGSINQGRYWSVRSAAESALVGDIKRAKTTFQSTHFEEPNILVHLRMNTRTDADGNKVLFLEELQSDWGQKGKREGFASNVKELPSNYKIKKIPTYGSILGDYLFEVIDRGELIASGYTEAEAKESALEWLNKKGTPAAPFVTDTNAWTKLGLKMALREAVKQGADKVAWTTGEQQNQRYDLSKQVDSINYLKNGDGTYQVYAKKNGDIVFKERALEENKLEGAFGKDVAERIINDKGTSEEGLATKVLSGSDLSVGGKGMKGFYDSIVPNVAQALVKELTGKPSTVGYTTFGTRENVGQSMPVRSTEDIKFYSKKGYEFMKGHRVISKQDAYAIIEEGREVTAVIAPSSEQQSIDITPELKAAVQEGMPQFSEGGRVSNEGPLKEGLTADAGITDLDMSRWMKQNNVKSFSDNPEAVEKFKKDFNATLSDQTMAQMSDRKAKLPKRFDLLVNDIVDKIGAAYDSGMNIDTAIKQELTSQPWYDSFSDEQKSDIDKIIGGSFSDEIAAQREREATEQGKREPLSDEVKSNTQQLEELYGVMLDGSNKEKRAAKEARDKILASDPKLKYIWKNYRNILKQLQDASSKEIELTKSEACP